MKYFKIIKRESKTGINLRVKFANRSHPFGFEELDGFIHAENIVQATAAFKQLIKNALLAAGFAEKGEKDE